MSWKLWIYITHWSYIHLKDVNESFSNDSKDGSLIELHDESPFWLEKKGGCLNGLNSYLGSSRRSTNSRVKFNISV